MAIYATKTMFKHLAARALLASSLWFSIPLSAVTYPALPTATVDVRCCPASTRTVAVHTAVQLQAAFDNAALGDEIVLDAGLTYEGNFILRVPTGTSGWVTVRSSATAALPSPGTRVGLSDAINMAKIMSPNFGNPGATTDPALANNYNQPPTPTWECITIVSSASSSPLGLRDLQLSRYIYCSPSQGCPISRSTNAA